MERQFYINWSAFVEEAKQRRKAQRLTQARLAQMVGVSTPTISRFENGAKDIQLSSVLSILHMLGMVDMRKLIFSQGKARYEARRMVVIFTGKDGDKTIQCAISHEALEDYFVKRGERVKEPLKIFEAQRERIEHMDPWW